MEPTSEQELKQLLEEGKITEEDYRQLLEAIHQKDKPQDTAEKTIQVKPRTGFGKAALILMVIGFILPAASLVLNVILFTPAGYETSPRIVIKNLRPFILLGSACLALAFIFGIIGRRSKAGKFAAFGVPCLVLLEPFLIGLFYMGALFFIRTTVEQNLVERHLVSHKAYPLDSMEGVLTRDGVAFDEKVSSDAKGSLRIQTTSPDKTVVHQRIESVMQSAGIQTTSPDKTVIRIFETGPMGIDNKMLIYSAKLRTEKLDGKAYLEMWCGFPDQGEFFSRGLDQPVMGTTEWTTAQTPFRLEAGQIPANVKLNLVIEGAGTVWIDDIKLLSSPLN